MKHLFSKFLVSFFITSAVVLSWSEYFYSYLSISKVFLISITNKYLLLTFNLMEQKKGLFWEFTLLLFETYARWKGTGEPWSNVSLKIVKNFPGHFWKILCFLISVYGPLSHGIWILDWHPSIKTLAFLEHSGQGPRQYSQKWRFVAKPAILQDRKMAKIANVS